MRLRIVIPAVIALSVLAGCGDGNDSSSSGGGGSGYGAARSTAADDAKAKPGAVNIADFKYVPGTLTVKAGSKVTFANADSAKHTATADDASFDTKDLEQDAKASVTLAKAGTYAYHCAYHRFMEGEIVVK